MRWSQPRIAAVGFVAAGLLLGGLLWLADGAAVLAALARADPALAGALFGLALVWLAAWGITLKTVLGALQVPLSVVGSFLVYTAAVFANNVTPFGFAGGEAVSALFVSSATDTRYETGLAAIATVDVLNAVSSLALVLLGLGVFAGSITMGTGLRSAVGSVLVVAVLVTALFGFVWRHRLGLIDRVSGAVARLVNGAGRRVVGTRPITKADAKRRLSRFVGHIEAIGGDPRTLATAILLSTSGWVVQSIALVVAFAAIGHQLSVVVALVVIPIANLAGMTPLPGGLGGIEAAFVALLVPTTGMEAAVVIAGVLLFRAAIYWLPIVLGGTWATVTGTRSIV